MEQLSKFIEELRAMTEGLSPGRFYALWSIAFTIALGYLISKIPWDLLLTH